MEKSAYQLLRWKSEETFNNVFASDWDWLVAFGAFLFISELVADHVIAYSLDEQALTVWAIGVLVLRIWNIAEIWVEHSCPFCHVVRFF